MTRDLFVSWKPRMMVVDVEGNYGLCFLGRPSRSKQFDWQGGVKC